MKGTQISQWQCLPKSDVFIHIPVNTMVTMPPSDLSTEQVPTFPGHLSLSCSCCTRSRHARGHRGSSSPPAEKVVFTSPNLTPEFTLAESGPMSYLLVDHETLSQRSASILGCFKCQLEGNLDGESSRQAEIMSHTFRPGFLYSSSVCWLASHCLSLRAFELNISTWYQCQGQNCSPAFLNPTPKQLSMVAG